jgi:hypothetical protein
VFGANDEAAAMFKLVGFGSVAAVLALTACEVQVRDTTPAELPANHDIGMYGVSATVTREAMVTPGSVYMFALVDNNQKITLDSNQDGSAWHGLYSVRCRSSFPLQFLAQWKLQGLSVRQKLVPSQPRQIRLTEPPPTRTASIDSSGKAPKGGWQGGVQYRFVTVPGVQITAARIEPTSEAPEDVAAAKAISVVTPLPVVAGCGDQAEIRLASRLPRAHGTLVIDTNHPAVPRWQTVVEFSPK